MEKQVLLSLKTKKHMHLIYYFVVNLQMTNKNFIYLYIY